MRLPVADLHVRATRARRSLPYPVRRLLQAVPLVAVIAVMNFFWLRLAPGDLADVIASTDAEADCGPMHDHRVP